MSENNNGKPQSQIESLMEEIAQISNIDLEKVKASPLPDFKEMHRRDTEIASREIAQQQSSQHKKYAASRRRSCSISSQWRFGSESVVIDENNAQAFQTAENLTRNEIAGQYDHSHPDLIFICGGPGSGKTVLANCIANAWLEQEGVSVEYMTFADIRKQRSYINNEPWLSVQERESAWNDILNADNLTVENLATMGGFTIYEQKSLSELLDNRLSNGKCLVLTSVHTIQEMPNFIGAACFEELKEFRVCVLNLFGLSRRPPINFNGMHY